MRSVATGVRLILQARQAEVRPGRRSAAAAPGPAAPLRPAATLPSAGRVPCTSEITFKGIFRSFSESGTPVLVATVDPKTPRAKQDFGEFRMQFVGPGF